MDIEKRDDMLENQRLHFIDFAKQIASHQFPDIGCEIPGGMQNAYCGSRPEPAISRYMRSKERLLWYHLQNAIN